MHELDRKLILLLLLFSACISAQEKARVVKVIDGDTILLDSGEKVRLLGIDAPERGEACYEEAKTMLEKLVLNRTVTLERDLRDRDKYGRLLRYVFVNRTFVNALLVSRALARPYLSEDVLKYRDSIKEAWKNARGCLKLAHNCSSCMELVKLDPVNEYFVLVNICNHSCELSNWVVKDAAGNRFTFKHFSLGQKATVTVFTGCGKSNSTALFWCRKRPVWNNEGDTFFLFDSHGKLVLKHAYGSS